jgi:pSer/pThr/pTyr-binding forkhead associated (FHA) protein
MGLSLRPLEPGILPGGIFRIPEGVRSITVGRARANELRVQHASVSSFHATIDVHDDASVEVIDHESSNGTFVNGIRVGRHRLVEGDLLRFATAEFRIQSGSADAVAVENSAKEPGGEEPRSEGASGGDDRDSRADSVALLPGAGLETVTEPETKTQREPDTERPLPLSEVETAEARAEGAFAAERGILMREIDQLREGRDEASRSVASLQALLDRRETDVRERDEFLRNREDEIRRLRRDLDEAVQREQRLLAGQSEARREVIEREGVIAGLNYELQTRDGQLRQSDEQRARLQQTCDDHAAALAELEATHARTTAALVASESGRAAAQAYADHLLERLDGLAGRLLGDWRDWITGDLFAAIGDGADEGAVFARVAAVADAIRGELDRIEPIWHRYGEGVQDELMSRCNLLRADLGGLGIEIARGREELSSLDADLARLREIMDLEVRRAQGLSRKSIEIEIPERFEAMTIARDREQELLRALVERIEVLDQLLEGYRGSRKMRGVHHELADFRRSLSEILDAGGVRAFEIAVGTSLTLRHRREVQILGRKGWGTRQYAEIPFQPGEVVKVIRPGYRVSEGDGAVILRKVEVLIQGVEE